MKVRIRRIGKDWKVIFNYRISSVFMDALTQLENVEQINHYTVRVRNVTYDELINILKAAKKTYQETKKTLEVEI